MSIEAVLVHHYEVSAYLLSMRVRPVRTIDYFATSLKNPELVLRHDVRGHQLTYSEAHLQVRIH